MQFQSGEWVSVPSVPQEQQTVSVAPEKRLSVVIPFIEKETFQVLDLLNKSFALSGQISRNCFLVPFKGMDVKSVQVTAQQAFSSVGVISDAEGVISDWQEGRPMRDAAGPNSLFRQASWFFYLNKRFPAWLWMEPDCIPTTSDWFYQLETEYFNVGRPFYGVKMRMPDGTEYMNGVGIYPWNAVQYAPLLVQSTMWKQFPEIEAGFDVAGGKDVLNRAHLTRKIQLEIGNKNQIQLRPETVLVHGRNNLSGNDMFSEHSDPMRSHGGNRSTPPLSNVDTTSTAAQSNLGAHGDPGEPDTVLGKESVYVTHETRPHLSNGAASETNQDGSDYGRISREIKSHVEALNSIWNGQPHRKVKIIEELRRVKLVPKHFK